MIFLAIITAVATSITASWAIISTLKSWLPLVKCGNILINKNYTPIIITKFVAQEGTLSYIKRDEKGAGSFADSGKVEIRIDYPIYYDLPYGDFPRVLFINGKKFSTYIRPAFDFSRGIHFFYIKIKIYPLKAL